MVFEPILRRFVEQTPICVMAQMVLENQFGAARLDAIFEEVAQEQYSRELLFSTCAGLLCQVTLCGQPAIHAAFKNARAEIPTSIVSVYNKLKGVEPAVCQALVARTADAVEEVLQVINENRPEPIPGYRLRIADGNVLGRTERRLKVLRGSDAAALPGMSLVLYDYSTSVIRRLLVSEDSHTSERRLMPALAACLEPGDLLLSDRNFATLDFMADLDQGRVGFLIRHHASLKLTRLGKVRSAGRCRTGKVSEQMVQLSNGAVFRAIYIDRDEPLRSGGRRVTLLTNVPRAKAKAKKLAELYLKRWKIEEAFRQLTQYLSCEVRTLGYPRAALLAFSLAVMAYNCLACVHGALAREQGREKVEDELSAYFVALEVQLTHRGMMVAVPARAWAPFAGMSAKELSAALRQVAQHVDWRRYTKSKRGPKKPRSKYRRKHVHVATAQLLVARKTATNSP